MADYLDILRGALSLGGFSPAPSQQMDRLLEIFRGRGGTPAPSAPGAPVTPAPTETAPPQIPGQPAQTARPRPPAPSPEMPLPPEPTSQVPAQAPRPTLLDQLRERVSQDTSSGGLRTAGDIGAGMLASRSPNFFTMLGEGLKAAQTGEQQRTRDLREAASTEAVQAYRQRMLELKEEEMRDPSVRALREAQAYYYRQRPEMAGAGAANRSRVSPAQYATMYNQAEEAARRQYPDPAPGMPEPESARQERLANRERYRDARLQQLLEGAAQIQSGQLPTPQPAQPQQGPGQRVQVPLTGTPR